MVYKIDHIVKAKQSKEVEAHAEASMLNE